MSLAGLDLNLLKVLDALLREGSTVAAGRRIGLSQPAVSAALGRLRVALKDDLFVRQGQGLTPTEFARGLEAPLREMLDGLDELIGSAMDWSPATARDVVRLSGLDYFAEMLAPELARIVARDAPGLRLQFLDLVPDDHFKAVEDGTVDLALLPNRTFPPWIEHEVVLTERFALVACADNPRLARVPAGGEVPLDLFCDLRHVLCSPDGKLRGLGDDALEAMGRSREVVMSLPFFSGVAGVVAGTDLVSLLPLGLAKRLAPRLGLTLYRAPIRAPQVALAMAWHRRSTQAPANRWVRRHIAQILAALGDDPDHDDTASTEATRNVQ